MFNYPFFPFRNPYRYYNHPIYKNSYNSHITHNINNNFKEKYRLRRTELHLRQKQANLLPYIKKTFLKLIIQTIKTLTTTNNFFPY